MEYGTNICQKIWPKCPKLDGPEYVTSQNEMAGTYVRRKIISLCNIGVRFDDYFELLSYHLCTLLIFILGSVSSLYAFYTCIYVITLHFQQSVSNV